MQGDAQERQKAPFHTRIRPFQFVILPVPDAEANVLYAGTCSGQARRRQPESCAMINADGAFQLSVRRAKGSAVQRASSSVAVLAVQKCCCVC